jgi:general secretion pathway protein H
LIASRAGFTLLEITIVIIIMGIALGIVGMIVSKDRGSLEVKTFTRELAAVLRYARSHAVTEKKTYCFVINREDRQLRLYTDKICRCYQ